MSAPISVTPLQLLFSTLATLAAQYGIDQIEEWVKDFHGDPRFRPQPSVPHEHSFPVTGGPGACDYGDPIENYNFRELEEATRFCDVEDED